MARRTTNDINYFNDLYEDARHAAYLNLMTSGIPRCFNQFDDEERSAIRQ